LASLGRRIAGRVTQLVSPLVVACASAAAPPASPAAETAAPTSPRPPVPPPELPPHEFDAAAASDEPGWLGVALARRDPSRAGVEVTGVVPSSPAAAAGLESGDRLLRVGGEPVESPEDVVRAVSIAGAGRRVDIALLRGGSPRLVAARLEAPPDKDEMVRRAYVGRPAPPFERLATAQGSLAPSLVALRGKVLVVEFWAPWCAVCRLIAPRLNEWHTRYSPQGAAVVGVTTESIVTAGTAARELGMDYPIFSDETARTSEAYAALALPTIFVIDRGGVVRDVLVGYDDPGLARLERLVTELIAAR
jgi:peroxiredoxin